MPPITLASLTRSTPAATPAPAPLPVGDLQMDTPTPVLDALSLRSGAMQDLPYANGVKLVAAVNSGLTADDPYDAAATANSLISVLAPALNETIVGAGLNAWLLSTGSSPVRERKQALKDSVKQFKQSSGDRVAAALGVAAATTQLTVIYRAIVNAAYAVGKYVLKIAGRHPELAEEVQAVRQIGGAFAASGLGRTLAFLNKWIPLVNATWILMAARTAFQVYDNKASSTTSKTLACLNIGMAVGLMMAGVGGSFLAFALTIAAALLVELGLATARNVDEATGDMDRRVNTALAHPGYGAAAVGRWLVQVFHAMTRQKVNQAKNAVARLHPDAPPVDPRRALVKGA